MPLIGFYFKNNIQMIVFNVNVYIGVSLLYYMYFCFHYEIYY